MKILLIGPFPNPIHGMSLANENMYNCFLDDNYDIDKHDTVFNRSLKSKDKQGKFDFKYFISSICNVFLLFLKMIKKKYTVVYITPGQSVLGFLRFLPILILAKLLSIKIIQHIHGAKLVDNILESNLFYRLLSKVSFLLTDKFILLSDIIADRYSKLLPKDKVEVCLNGISVPYECGEHDPSHGPLNVLFLSNLMKDKGILDIFYVIENYPDLNYLYHFAGEIEPEIKEYCIDFFKKHQSNCKYYGVVSGEEKENLLLKSDVFILPSYDEGIPLSILEAYAYSCAVITTDVGGIPDVFKNDVNGLSISPGCNDSIYTALREISNNLDKFKKTNRSLAVDLYSLKNFYLRIKKIIYKVC